MIGYIRNIGQYYQKENSEETPINGMIKTINSEDIKYILLINVKVDEITIQTKEFYKDIVYEALFYQSGNAVLGGGIRLDYYQEKNKDDPSKKDFSKGRRKLEKICKFCEIEDRYEEVKECIENYLKDNDNKTFAVIKIQGKMPQELYSSKFLERMYKTTYNKVSDKGKCHICGNEGKVYNTTTFKFYTNDKGIYKNINEKDNSGFIVDEDCLNSIIVGKSYINQYLSTYWGLIGEKVMFLPHHYSEDAASIFEGVSLNKEGQEINFINTIRLNEEDFLDIVGKTNTITDIIFYQDDTKFFNINYHIQSIMPTRFSYISNLMKKYSLNLISIIINTTATKISHDNIETTKKEKMRIIDSIFTGKRINRNLFFKRVTDVFKFYYLREEHKKFKSINTINKIYNFLCQCGCLEGEWDVLKKDYENYQEFFDVNQSYFDLNEKKAWFILGMSYNTTIYYMKRRGENNEGELDKTSLEKNFFFARKFDFNDFIYFANLIEDKMIKYKIDKLFLKKMLCEAKELMANRQNKLSIDEAKYIFFWGLDSYFGKNEKVQNISIGENIEEEVL